jgi:hypothetical protein
MVPEWFKVGALFRGYFTGKVYEIIDIDIRNNRMAVQYDNAPQDMASHNRSVITSILDKFDSYYEVIPNT